jgi:hypothetical protein
MNKLIGEISWEEMKDKINEIVEYINNLESIHHDYKQAVAWQQGWGTGFKAGEKNEAK